MISVDNKVLVIYLLLSQICCISASLFKTQSQQEKETIISPPSLATKSSDSRDVTGVGWVKVKQERDRERHTRGKTI